MSAPAVELADIIHAQGDRFLALYGSRVNYQQRKALRAIVKCRTAALGHHVDACPKCGYSTQSYNSCRNRHCPKCQSGLRQRWVEARKREVLGVEYFHVVFTVPSKLNPVALQNQRLLYNLLFKASAATLLEVATNRKHLGAKIGFVSILHTWGQNLQEHPHVHCLIPQGGVSQDSKSWVHSRRKYFLPKKILGQVFRGKFIEGLRRLYQKKKLKFAGAIAYLEDPEQFSEFIRSLYRHEWVIDVRPALGGAEKVIHYLGRYTRRVAISNHRLLNFDGKEITFLWKDYAHDGKWRKMTLDATEFLRRFVLHILPKGFVRVRFFGLMANRFRAQCLELCRKLLSTSTSEKQNSDPLPDLSAWFCPHCGTRMLVIQRYTPAQWSSRGSFIEN